MASEKEHSVLRVSELEIGYFSKKKKKPVGSVISFKIGKGELVGLVGANGIGKSTLLRTISGMHPQLGGTVSIHNKLLSAYTTLELATQLSIVLTEPPASKNLTVRELISLGRQPYTNNFGVLTSEDRKAINHALEITETNTLANRKCFELSDGQLQRAVIARALAQDTALIILDEPTTHLDLYHRAYILKLLKQLASENGKTILFSTHEIDLAIQLSDTMIIMEQSATHVDSPHNLIEAGRFNSLFPEDTIHFDVQSGRFTIRN